ncbi:hypothetical protein [Megasphaera stantonii]|uniref:hypothetical protein n=1 Tax=Megasphaera stantonii TaxID=2144175 RepID=UPI003208B377
MKDEDGKKYPQEERGSESVWEALGIAGDSEASVDVLEASGMTQRQQEHLWDEIRQLRYIDMQMKDAVQTGHEASLAFWQDQYTGRLDELERYMRRQGIPYRLENCKDFRKERGEAWHRKKLAAVIRRNSGKEQEHGRCRERVLEK